MATIYFTSNADSGDGTLRAAIASANDGDVITYDPAVFTSGPVVIALSSYLPAFPNNATLDGGELGIVIDGQNQSFSAYGAFRSTGTILTVINATLTRYKVTTNAPVMLNLANGNYTFKRCKFVENTGVWYGCIYLLNGSLSIYDSLIAGNVATGSATTSGGIAIAEGKTLNFVRSTLCGNRKGNIGSGSLTRLNNVNSFIGLTAPEIDGETPEEIGFVNPPPSAAIPEADYTAGDWQSWDFRLKPTSPYLTGAAYESGDVDLLGHARTGSWGAFDGSWIVVGTASTVAANQTVDWLDLGASAVLTLDGQDRILTVARGVYRVGTGASVVSSTNGFVVAPSADALTNATLTNVVCAVSGAGASNLAATTSEIIWSATDSTVSVVLQKQNGATWTTIAQTAGTSYSTTLSAGDVVRLFDGVQFLTATVPVPPGPTPTDFDFHAWGVYGATITVDVGVPYLTTTQTAATATVATGFILMSDYYNRGETPVLFARIQNSETGDPISPSAVSSITYTAYRQTVGWGTESRTPVSGHENVTIPNTAVLSAVVPPSTDPRWTVDSTGYNFLYEPDSRTNPIFPDSGNYVVVVTINFTNANPIPVVFNVSVN